MIRKLLLVAAAIAMPASAGAVALVTTAPAASAAPAAINCHVGGTVAFASPGLTHNGKVTTATTSTTKVGTETFTKGTSACSGTGPALTITSTNIKCNAKGATTTIPACTGHPTESGYGSFDSYATTGVASIKADVKSVKFTINGTAYTSATCATSSCVAVHTCPTSKTYGSEDGFEIKGNISAPTSSPYKGQSTAIIVCLGSAAGTHLVTQSKATKPGFVWNLETGLGTTTADKAITVTSSAFDNTESSLNIA